MGHPLQEKFQVTLPGKVEGDAPWADFKSTRDLRGLQPWVSGSADDVDQRKFNHMPPGMELGNQFYSEQNQQRLSVAGESDVSKDTNPESFREGFTKRKMKGTDDQYTGEHVDHFYGDAGGFVERNNYLDRE
jgi:hypothetical protein